MQLELKAIVLLGRVNTFVQREPSKPLYRATLYTCELILFHLAGAPLIMQRDQSGLNSAAPDIRKT